MTDTSLNGYMYEYFKRAYDAYSANGVGSYRSTVALTRTSDTNLYAANDVIGAATGSTAALTFSSAAPVGGGHVLLTGLSLLIESSAVISGETSYTLHLYNVTPPSALGDNAAWDLPSGDRSAYIGGFNVGTPVDLGSSLFVRTDGINAQITAASADLYGYLVTVGSYTPTSGRIYNIAMRTVSL
jgi:hypothetical protein